MIFGFALLAPTLVRPLSGLIGRPLARFQGLTGMLARENTRRQPQRTAVTASALMIGVALVVLVAIFAAGLRATIDQGIDEQVKAVSIITHDDGFSPLPSAHRRRGREGRRRHGRLAAALRDRPRRRRDRQHDRDGHRPRHGARRDQAQVVRRLRRGALGPRHDRRGRPQGVRRQARPEGRQRAEADRAARQRGRLHGQGHLRARRRRDRRRARLQRLAGGRLGRQGRRVLPRRGRRPGERSRRARRRPWPASRPPSRRRSRASRTSRTSRSTRSSASSTRCSRCR